MQLNQLPVSVKDKIATAKMPVIYEQACRDLAACRTIDEALYFDNKADALAAWAKIHKSNQAAHEARALKLHAYRRMAQLAAELRPMVQQKSGRGFGAGATPGPRSLLIEAGLSKGQAQDAGVLGRLPAEEFEKYVAQPRPPSPSAVQRLQQHCSAEWRDIQQRLGGFRTFTRGTDAASMARGLSGVEALRAREMAIEVSDWLDTFEQHLPKAKP